MWIHTTGGLITIIYVRNRFGPVRRNNNYNRILKTERKRINNVNTHVTHAMRLDTEIFFRSFFLMSVYFRVKWEFWKTVL